MTLEDILIRSISGYVFVVPGLLLYDMYLKKSGKKQTSHRFATTFIFCYYLIGILTMTGIGRIKPFAPTIVLIPFADMIKGPVDTVLNVILFLPLGFFIPLLYREYERVGRTVSAGFFLSLAIELVQMFGRGTTDINDLISNTVGTCLGHFFYRLFSGAICKRTSEKFQSDKINGTIEMLLFTAYTFTIMITVQPWIIRSLFRLG